MIKSKALDLIRTFNLRDFKSLGEFLNSPIHNKNERLKKLYDAFGEYYPEFDDETLSRRSLFDKLHTGEEYKDNVMRKILSQFHIKVLDFLAYHNFNSNKLEIQKHLISELNKRNAEKFVEENYRDSEDILSYSKCSEDSLSYQYNVEIEKNISYLKKNKFMLDESIFNESNYLLRFFLAKILRRYAYILNKNYYEMNFEFKPVFLEEILKHLQEHSYDDIPAISLYYNIILMILNENDQNYFNRVITILKDKEKVLERIELYNSYFILNNYYLKKNDQGNNKYVRELFDLYKIQLEKKIYKYEEYIDPSLFMNIVKAGTRLKEFDWVEKFIERHIDEIEPPHRQSTYCFSMAVLSFFKKEYDNSLKFLSSLKINGVFHRLDVYTYMLRIYYERNEIEPILYMIDSFRHTLAKDSLIPEFKRSEYNSFLKFLNYLVKIKTTRDYSIVGMLRRELEKIHCVSCTGWFIEKFNYLELHSESTLNRI